MGLLSLKKIRKLRTQTKDLDIITLEKMLNNLRVLIKEKKEIKKQYEAQQRDSVEQFRQYLERLANEGVRVSYIRKKHKK